MDYPHLNIPSVSRATGSSSCAPGGSAGASLPGGRVWAPPWRLRPPGVCVLGPHRAFLFSALFSPATSPSCLSLALEATSWNWMAAARRGGATATTSAFKRCPREVARRRGRYPLMMSLRTARVRCHPSRGLPPHVDCRHRRRWRRRRRPPPQRGDGTGWRALSFWQAAAARLW